MEDKNVIKSGHLDVSDGYKLYFEEWGNKKATPIIYLHGGPGGCFGESNKLMFDPAIHHVIFHDQRGGGRSTPYASTKHNTTQKLIEDIEKLRNHLGIDLMYAMGGSWGSTLSLLYTISHPKRVKRLIIWGVYLATQFETDFVNEGYPRHTFPEAWEQFISRVPMKHRKSGTDIMKFYAEKMRSENPKIAKMYADEWTLWEVVLMSTDYDYRRMRQEVESSENTAIARIETHYFLNSCFIPENFIVKNISTIKHIPCSVIQGRFDFCTPPIGALNLQRAYGKNLTLQWTNAGHLKSEPANLVAIRATVNALFR